MSDTEQLTVTLPHALAERLRRSVAAGDYASVSDAVAAAIAMADAEYGGIEPDTETLRRLIQDGIDSGDAEEMSIDDIKAEARRRFGSLARGQ